MPDQTEMPILTERFQRALQQSLDLHRNHLRNSTTVPYFSHLMSVAALVMEDGGDEDEAIAALLHDALEDCADRVSGEELERDYGPTVRRLVEGCTDTPTDFRGGIKPGWKVRKEAYIARVRSGQSTRVSLADKVHNARSILRDHRILHDEVFLRFSASKEDTLWYYQKLASAYRDAGHHGFLVDELERTVSEIISRAGPVAAAAEQRLTD